MSIDLTNEHIFIAPVIGGLPEKHVINSLKTLKVGEVTK